METEHGGPVPDWGGCPDLFEGFGALVRRKRESPAAAGMMAAERCEWVSCHRTGHLQMANMATFMS